MIGIILASLAIAIGVLGTLMILVMCMAGAPNSSPLQIRRIKQVMLATAILGSGMAAVAIWLIVKEHYGWAALVGGFPMIVVIAGMVYLSLPRR